MNLWYDYLNIKPVTYRGGAHRTQGKQGGQTFKKTKTLILS